eukprot:TRINITY_DN10319_c0_g1_i1.p1 TRINITY_DN10319_c0_g1~~TRINITY_DN10319_c0_g1_i1.p1  ORF type:complete len:243 (-),score=30.32 TRINITY_DN10319_c0_g1_i1:19-747(-)
MKAYLTPRALPSSPSRTSGADLDSVRRVLMQSPGAEQDSAPAPVQEARAPLRLGPTTNMEHVIWDHGLQLAPGSPVRISSAENMEHVIWERPHVVTMSNSAALERASSREYIAHSTPTQHARTTETQVSASVSQPQLLPAPRPIVSTAPLYVQPLSPSPAPDPRVVPFPPADTQEVVSSPTVIRRASQAFSARPTYFSAPASPSGANLGPTSPNSFNLQRPPFGYQDVKWTACRRLSAGRLM